jgi:predicted permease
MSLVSHGVVNGVGLILVVAGVGFVGRRIGAITEQTLRELSRTAINLLLPCFLFEAVRSDFSWEHVSDYGSIMAAAVAFFALGIGLAWGFARALRLEGQDRSTALALSSFGNSLNIPLPLALAWLTPEESSKVVVLITLYNLVWSPLIWSVGVWLLAPSHHAERGWWRNLITPPAVAIILGVVSTAPPLSGVLGAPSLSLLHTAVTWVGAAAIPIAVVVLGGILGGMIHRMRFHAPVVGISLAVKLLALPAVVLAFLKLGPALTPMVTKTLMLEAATPPATNLIIIAEHYGGDTDTVGATILVTYVLCLITFVLWLGLVG